MTFLRRFSLIGAWAIAAALIIGQLGAFHPLADSFAHFRLHLAVLILPFLLLLLVLRYWWNAIAIAAVAAVSFGSLGQLIGAPPPLGPPPADQATLRVMSLNLHNHYADPDRVAAYVAETKPDVIAFQELSMQPPLLAERLKAHYPHQLICPSGNAIAIALLSRSPLAGAKCHKRLAWGTVEKNGSETTVASLHLRWPFPSGQKAQLDEFDAVWPKIGSPLVLVGDFNATPWSRAVNRVAEETGTRILPGLRRSYVWGDQSSGYVFSPPDSIGEFLALPIDQVLVAQSLKVIDAGLGPRVSSDHLPVVVDLQTTGF